MDSATDLRALGRHRLALIASARTVAAGTLNQPVAQSHPLGNATMRLSRQGGSRIGAVQSHVDATTATADGRTSCTVASPIGCDYATPPVSTPGGVQRAAAKPHVERTAPSKRQPSWADSTDRPLSGDHCSCCRWGRWWCETIKPRGWRCWTCHPPDHLPPDAVTEVST